MSRLSSSPLIAAAALLALSATGCAAKFHAQSSASWNASASGSWNGQASAQTGYNSGQWGGQAAPAQPTPASQQPQPSQQPEIYGVPLAGAQDVVFVLDCSGSMAGTLKGGTLPSTPVAGIASIGIQITSAAQNVIPTTPALPSLLSVQQTLSSPSVPTFQLPREDKLQAAKAELVGALSTLPDNTRFDIVYFNDGPSDWANGLQPMNVIRRVGAISFVQGIPATGTTAAVSALRVAYQIRPARVVLLSDGLANTGGDRNVVLYEARAQMRRGVRFDTVGLGADQDADLLAAMARESGGVMVSR